jgi:hypothetical protein
MSPPVHTLALVNAANEGVAAITGRRYIHFKSFYNDVVSAEINLEDDFNRFVYSLFCTGIHFHSNDMPSHFIPRFGAGGWLTGVDRSRTYSLFARTLSYWMPPPKLPS